MHAEEERPRAHSLSSLSIDFIAYSGPLLLRMHVWSWSDICAGVPAPPPHAWGNPGLEFFVLAPRSLLECSKSYVTVCLNFAAAPLTLHVNPLSVTPAVVGTVCE